MNIKETVNFVQLQEQMLNVLIRVSALEKVLRDSNVLNAELYNKELTNTAAIVSEKLKSVYEKIDNLKESLSSTEENKEDVKEEIVLDKE